MNLKLQHVVSDITGKTGMDIIRAIVAGERNPQKLAKLRDYRTKADQQTYRYRMTGVDLAKIDGIDGYTALKVISEIGLDMTRWPTSKHITSWMGLCPGSKITGGKALSSRTKPSANRAAAALRLAANSLHRSNSALGAFLRRKKAQLGTPQAITATAHKLARLIYSMLKYGHEYVDAGQDYYENQYRDRALRNLTRRAKEPGYNLVATPQPSPTAAFP